MAASDLVITSSGDTCAEARTVGRPLLLLDVVPGHGRDNLQHELELGDAAVTSPRPAEMVRSALAALDRVKPPSGRSAGRRSRPGWATPCAARRGLESIVRRARLGTSGDGRPDRPPAGPAGVSRTVAGACRWPRSPAHPPS